MSTFTIFVVVAVGIIAAAILEAILDWIIKPKLLGKSKFLLFIFIFILIIVATFATLLQLNYQQNLTTASSQPPAGASPTQIQAGISTSGKIVFVSWRTGTPHVYIMNSDGSNQVRLTDLTYPEYAPRWSPDDRWVVLSSQTGATACGSSQTCAVWDILKVDVSSSQFVNLTNGYTLDNEAPAFSPDGHQVAFVAGLNDTSGHLVIMNQDGTDKSPTSVVSANYPDWSPDGLKILFTSPWGSPSGVYTYNPESGAVEKIISGEVGSIAHWSSDGQLIAFSMKINGTEAIYTIHADGTGLTRLTYNSYNNSAPEWSEDGKWLAFTSDRDGNTEIYVMKTDGTSQERLTYSTSQNLWPDWSK